MTDREKEDSREAFEAWAKPRGFNCCNTKGRYHHSLLQDYWIGWQARGEFEAARATPAQPEVVERVAQAICSYYVETDDGFERMWEARKHMWLMDAKAALAALPPQCDGNGVEGAEQPVEFAAKDITVSHYGATAIREIEQMVSHHEAVAALRQQPEREVVTQEAYDACAEVVKFLAQDPCSYDDHGNCQTHFIEKPCSIAEAMQKIKLIEDGDTK